MLAHEADFSQGGPMNNSSFLDRVFHLAENGTTVKTEILAGITTFMTWRSIRLSWDLSVWIRGPFLPPPVLHRLSVHY